MKHATIPDANLIDKVSYTANARGRPLHRLLVSFSVAYFAAALVTDLAYWQIPDVLWERFSIWLIVAGLVMAGLATIAYLIDLASSRQIDRPIWPRVAGYALAVVLSVLNAFVHSRDGYTAVVPTGLFLSVSAIIILLLTALIATALANRQSIGGKS